MAVEAGTLFNQTSASALNLPQLSFRFCFCVHQTSDRVCSSSVFQAELARVPFKMSEASNFLSESTFPIQSEKALPENVFFNRMHFSQRTECTKFSCCCRHQDSCENVYDMSYTSKTTNLLLLCRSVPVEGQADLLPHLEDLQHHGQP